MAQMVGIIGGSWLGDALGEHIESVKNVEVDTPFGAPSGKIMMGKLAGVPIAFINRHGDGHKFNPSTVPYAANIFALKKLGVTAVISTCAAGSLEEKIKPKDVVIVDQVIDKTFKRQTTFFEDIAVHSEMAEPYCGRLRGAIIGTAADMKLPVHQKATYVCMEGQQFSTKAEALMHIRWGGNLIGMTAMPEAKLAREAQMCFALVAMVSDYDCWREKQTYADAQTLLEEIIGNLNAATAKAIELIKAVLKSGRVLCDETCHCRKSLALAIWTKPEMIAPKYGEIIEVLKR
jgi:5'-methylthioadenosine phosphorylase